MREIKFRAWDGKYMTMFSLEIDSSGELNKLPNRHPDFPYLHLMQYTGLKDKNGKEIYEGDVIEFETPGGTQRPYVSFEPLVAAFVVDYWKKGKKESDAEFLHNEVEIIGNVYEKTELLSNR